MRPYTYIAIHRSSGYFYYGVRISNILPAEEDLGKVYFTSSKTVKTIIEAEGPDSFIWKVRRKFDDPEKAVHWEYKVIRRLLGHPLILNKSITPINVPGNWYTNGDKNILGKYCPVGYWPGRTYKETEARKTLYEEQKKNRWWNNGIKAVFCQIAPNNDWVPGRLKQHCVNWTGKSLTGSKWWNNGIVNYRGNCPPDGFVPGRLDFTRKKCSRPRTVEENLRHSNKMKKKKWWNNGSATAFTENAPPGFVAGRLRKKSN